jgi:steroid delta-isomerase-like uncharacterized protein
MPPFDAKALVRRYVERVWNSGDFRALAELTTETFAYYLAGQPERDRAGTQQFLEAVRIAFPDWHVEIAECFADGNAVVIRWWGKVTHQGPFHALPPTGRRISVSGINIYHIADGLIAAEFEQTDSLGILQQLGALG